VTTLVLYVLALWSIKIKSGPAAPVYHCIVVQKDQGSRLCSEHQLKPILNDVEVRTTIVRYASSEED